MKYALHFTLYAILLVLPLHIFCCGNEYDETSTYTRNDGSTIKTYSDHSYYFSHGFDRETLLERKRNLEKELNTASSFKTQSDYGLVLLKLGERRKALKIFEELILKYPGEYTINANLGTAYELNGNNKLALKYIQQSVKITPLSHKGSEWIHVEILKAKIKDETQPDYILKNSIIKMNADIHRKYSTVEIEHYNKVKEELEWQLKERIAFVEAPDLVVANLLFDLANLIVITEYLETSLPVYDKAIEYNKKSKRIQSRRDEVKSIIFEAQIKKYALYTLVFGSVTGGVFYLIRRRRIRNKKRKTTANVIYN